VKSAQRLLSAYLFFKLGASSPARPQKR
jgi:hypothetical protein